VEEQRTAVFGNLTAVVEPSPTGGADWSTTYAYNVINKLTNV
jgi:hypothetical protein